MKKLLSILLSAVMLLSLASCKRQNTDTTAGTVQETDTTAPADTLKVPDYVDADAVFFKSENYTVTTREFQYFLAKVYDDFASQYGDMISYILDTSTPLRSQTCPVDSTGETSWYDYFADGAMSTVESYILLAEEAKDVGFELTEEDLTLIEDELAQLDVSAEEAGYDNVEDYIRDYYGSLCTKESLRNCFTLSYLASSYRVKLYNGYTFTEEEYLAYAEGNKTSCYYADFMYMPITANIPDGATDEQKAAEWEKTQQIAINFNNAVTDKESFLEQAEIYLRSVSTIVDSKEKENEDTKHYTEETLMDKVNGTETVGYVTYSTGTANVDWIFAEGRLAGEQTVIMNEDTYTCEVIFMLQPMYLSEVETVDVRHILITASEQGDEYAAYNKANEIYEEWKAGDATEESFAELAIINSADTGSVSTGGLYQAVTPGQMVTEFNDWCFDDSRKSGDTDIVKTTYGYHIMYFVKQGLPLWKNTADTKLREASFTADMETLAKKFTLERYDESTEKCPDLFE